MISAAGRTDAGFTLVEVLVALSVIGLMSGLMLGVMGQFRHLTVVDHRLVQQAALQKTARHIASLFEHAESLPLEITPDAPPHFLESKDGSARFLAVAKSGALATGLFEIRIGLEGQGGASRLVETISPRRAPDNENGTTSFDLLESVERLTFSYLQTSAAPGLEPVWRADWRITGQMPEAVRVSIQTKDKSGSPASASAVAYLAR
jgi:prepilin-type N-terminal cleavage/methylation domain-containing protein